MYKVIAIKTVRQWIFKYNLLESKKEHRRILYFNMFVGGRCFTQSFIQMNS